MSKIGLVLEGGGFRGIFAEGVTTWLLEHNIHLPYVIGVSMGATNGVNYVSKQPKRNLNIVEEFINDPRYLSKRNLITQGSLFGMDFIFNDIALKYNKFDFNAFENSEQEFVVGAMNCETGKTSYMKKSKNSNEAMMEALRASMSLPFVAQTTFINGVAHLDGGLTDPIPAKKALNDGCDKILVISTRHNDYIKEPFRGTSISKLFYREYPNVANALKNRHIVYTETQGYLKGLEQTKRAFVIRPESPLDIGRTEKNLDKIRTVFMAGYNAAEKNKSAIISFLNS